MCASPSQAPPTLAAAVERAHCWSEHALTTPGRAALDSVWWLSTHLATVERVVHPVVARALPDGPALAREQRRRAAEIVRALWTLEHALTGDGRVRPSAPDVVRRLAALVRAHAEAEDEMVARLSAVLPDPMLSLLHHRYAVHVRRAPTRPHPLNAGRPSLSSLLFRVEGVLDRARDVLDSRHVPRRLAG
jgi:hypothetical protein